jgi:hypothetical protein
MKQVIVSVMVKNDDDRDLVMHLDVPESEVDNLIESIGTQCEAFETEDLGPGDDDYIDDEEYDDDDDEEEELDFEEEY